MAAQQNFTIDNEYEKSIFIDLYKTLWKGHGVTIHNKSSL